jgi:IstB-like ATP binding protein/Helix-turn-helix domain
MANRLTMAEIDRILTLHTTEHSNREIADLLGFHRETIGKYVARAKSQNQPNAPSGSNGTSQSGPRSECGPFRELILAKVEQGFLAKRIHQDLAEDHGEAFEGHDKVMTRYLKPDLLILDDMGLKQLPKRSGEYLFEIIMRRHQLHSTMMTSNRPLEDWGKLMNDVPAATWGKRPR